MAAPGMPKVAATQKMHIDRYSGVAAARAMFSPANFEG